MLRDHEELKFQSLLVVSATDFPKSESNDDERIEVFYSVYSYKIHQQLDFKCKLDRNNPQVASLSDVYRSANWYERESYDLVGVDFVGHPYQKRILLPTDWVGHPLRKDYEFPEEYNGMKVPL